MFPSEYVRRINSSTPRFPAPQGWAGAAVPMRVGMGGVLDASLLDQDTGLVAHSPKFNKNAVDIKDSSNLRLEKIHYFKG